MGRTHVISTAALGLATAVPLAAVVLHRDLSVPSLLGFVAVTAGYGILPDLDHPQATLARTLGPVTKAVSTGVAAISGGHRKGTHTLWCAALVTFLVTVLAANFGRAALLPVVFVGIYLAAMVTKLAPGSKKGEMIYAAEAIAGTAALWYFVPDWWFVPWAVGFGVIGHIVGDILTVEGVPVLYPLLPKFVVRVPILGRTDSGREHLFAGLLTVGVVWAVFAAVMGHPYWTVAWVQTPGAWSVNA